MPKDQRGRLIADPFEYRVTKDGKLMISRAGRRVGVVAGTASEQLRKRLTETSDKQAVQILLARATGHYRHGTERR
ncbi:MAG: hypothetical protein M3077_02975 [Candidatus Dormibacteraeota bacterium]|nr:hypothetical protein [Candidatus Dormibacteraeota bacterium]